MTSKLFIFTILFHIVFIKCDDVVKSSLAFVFNDNASMKVDLEKVKNGIDAIFDTVANSKYTPIDNFVLATFNDPVLRPVTVTRDRNTFKRALNNIVLSQDAISPGNSLTVLENTIKECLPNSYIYVFTDRPAKDHEKYGQVKSLAQKKSSQIVFVLTGDPDYNKEEPGYMAYHQLAEATSGYVFSVEKPDVSKVIAFMKDSVEASTIILAREDFPPGQGQELSFIVDEFTWDVRLLIFGDSSQVTIYTDSQKEIKECKKPFCILNLNTKLGLNSVEISSEYKTKAIVDAKSSVYFFHGFSTQKPSSMDETTAVPKSGAELYLAIKLVMVDGGDIKLTQAKLLDMNGEVILEKSLQLVDEKDRFYVTDDPITVPVGIKFDIMVVGDGVKNDSPIVRITKNLIEAEN